MKKVKKQTSRNAFAYDFLVKKKRTRQTFPAKNS